MDTIPKNTPEGYDILSDKVDNGEPICKAKFSVTIFSNSKDGVFRAAQEAASYLNTYQFKMIPDTNFVCPIFLSTLPMFNEVAAEKQWVDIAHWLLVKLLYSRRYMQIGKELATQH